MWHTLYKYDNIYTMKVISKKTIHFPKFDWGIHAGEKRKLPKDKEMQEAILEHKAISKIKSKSKSNKK